MAQQPSGPPSADDSLVECALKVLNCPDPWKKAEFTYEIVRLWRDGVIKRVRPVRWEHLSAPERPARSDDKVKICAPGEAPRRGKGGSLASRQALLHSAVHIENWAVDLSWDAIARFGLRAPEYGLPRQFFDDFVTVAEDECRHFTALAKRLEETGSHYGAFVVHDGLWESAANTAHSLPARLAVEHCVHEARGLDVLPATIAKFANNGDSQSAALLRDVVYPEEVAHCAAGVRWIRYLYDVAHGTRPLADPADPGHVTGPSQHPQQQQQPQAHPLADGSTLNALLSSLTLRAAKEGFGVHSTTTGDETAAAAAATAGQGESHGRGEQSAACSAGTANGQVCGQEAPPAGLPSWVLDARQYGNVEEWFHSLVRSHFWGALKPPFNEEARAKAGFGPEWYLPLAVQSRAPAAPQPPTETSASAAVAPPTATQSPPQAVPQDTGYPEQGSGVGGANVPMAAVAAETPIIAAAAAT